MIVLTEDLAREREEERRLGEIQAKEWAATGHCVTCGCYLATHLDRGILLCAGSHKEQYSKFLQLHPTF